MDGPDLGYVGKQGAGDFGRGPSDYCAVDVDKPLFGSMGDKDPAKQKLGGGKDFGLAGDANKGGPEALTKSHYSSSRRGEEETLTATAASKLVSKDL